jgi:hypothetical protein
MIAYTEGTQARKKHGGFVRPGNLAYRDYRTARADPAGEGSAGAPSILKSSNVRVALEGQLH